MKRSGGPPTGVSPRVWKRCFTSSSVDWCSGLTLTTLTSAVDSAPFWLASIEAAFAETWPAPDLVNLLDDSLSRDRALTSELTKAIYGRFDALGAYSMSIGADGILAITPYVWAPTTTSIHDYFVKLCRSIDLPVLSYNSPSYLNGVEISGETYGMAFNSGITVGTPFVIVELASLDALARASALVSLLIWISIVSLGRWIAYI